MCTQMGKSNTTVSLEKDKLQKGTWTLLAGLDTNLAGCQKRGESFEKSNLSKKIHWELYFLCQIWVWLSNDIHILTHRVLAEELNPRISKVNRIWIFSRGWVMGTTPYAQFFPIPSPLMIFQKTIFYYTILVIQPLKYLC